MHYATELNFAVSTVLKLTIDILLYIINLLDFIMVKPCVFCEVRTKILNKMYVN